MSKNQGDPVEIENFEPFLRKWLSCEHLKLVNLVAKTMLPLGENYCSEIVKIDVTIRRTLEAEAETLHFVAKTPCFIERPIVSWSDVFLKEVYMYSVLLPAYKKLEEQFGGQSSFDSYPKYIGHRCSLDDNKSTVDGHSMLVLENLRAHDFYTCDRRVGLDLEHARKTLSSLAKFHALGIVFMQKHPECVESIISQTEVHDVDFAMLDEGLDTMLKTIRENDVFNKHLQVIESSFAESKNGYILTRSGTKPWLTVTHGDFWVNNMMFHKNKDGHVDDVKFIDFQLYLYNSSLKDLPGFLCNGVDESTRTNHLDELIDYYYDTFIGTLRYFGLDTKPFAKEEFEKELKRQAIILFPGSALALKFFVVEINEEHKGSTILNDLCKSEVSDQVVMKLQKLIHVYEERKWF